ncbi:MAG: hypothetical protein U0R76_10895 [Candidatus Nanopelagicales bacterium]
MNGNAGLAFWLASALLFAWCAVATRRHDREQELDVYERLHGGGWG